MAFVGLRVPHETARLLGELEVAGDKEPVSNLHTTVLYLGKDVPVEQIASSVTAIYEVTSKTKPFTVETSIVTSFPPNPDDGVPIIARIESEPLHQLQAALKAALKKHGVAFSDKYPEYKPHVTLAYLQDGEAPADIQIPPVTWGVGEVVLWGGDTGDNRLIVTFPFSLNGSKQAAHKALVRIVSNRLACEGSCGCGCGSEGLCQRARVATRYLRSQIAG
jgi:2'-5' RNA ligase